MLDLLDTNKDDKVTLQEFLDFHNAGKTLPDFGLGVGAHGDAEYEYEIHHFEKYHNEDSPEEELNHPEDIAHVGLFFSFLFFLSFFFPFLSFSFLFFFFFFSLI